MFPVESKYRSDCVCGYFGCEGKNYTSHPSVSFYALCTFTVLKEKKLLAAKYIIKSSESSFNKTKNKYSKPYGSVQGWYSLPTYM